MTYREFWQPLATIYPEGEARWIGRMVLEQCFGLSWADVLMGSAEQIDEKVLRGLLQRLLNGEPVQYVIGEALFMGRRLQVGPGVLIPRPETEGLCRLCLGGLTDSWQGTILDIGTGSGCIAITLAAELPQASVTAWDVSDEALRMARANADEQHVRVSFERQDALCPPIDTARWDMIVSNPPYVCHQERNTMERHVLDHEPALALFVPDDEPLLFYSAIGRYAKEALRPRGLLFFEINPIYALQLADMLRAQGFAEVSILQDDYRKDRYIRAANP